MTEPKLNLADAEAVKLVGAGIGRMIAGGFTIEDVRAVLPDLWRSAHAAITDRESGETRH